MASAQSDPSLPASVPVWRVSSCAAWQRGISWDQTPNFRVQCCGGTAKTFPLSAATCCSHELPALQLFKSSLFKLFKFTDPWKPCRG